MTKNRFSSLAYRTKDAFIDILKSIKWPLIITLAIILIGFFVGIIFAFTSLSADYINQDIVLCFLTGNMASFSSMLYRILSSLVVLILLLLFSRSKWLAPLALILLFYRAYLLGINIGIMLRFYGLSGIIVAILILLPIQLIMLFYFSFFYWALLTDEKNCILKSVKNFFLISILVIIAINLVLLLLLALFSPNVILVL